MAKDPAFLFYPGDWLGGTMGMDFEEKGAYIDLLIFQFNRGPFTEKQALSFLKNKNLWGSIKIKFECIDGIYENKRLSDEKNKRQNYTESRRQSRLKGDEDNVRIYIVRDNVRLTYKIGSSVNPIRRYNELSTQNNPAIMDDIKGERNITLVWYSDAVLRNEENILHKYFNSKRLNGEWFQLNNDDLAFIFKKFKGTYVERTNDRTENEDVVINKDDGFYEKNKTDLNMVVLEMYKVWKNKNPMYPKDEERDYSALLQFAYKIAESKGWSKNQVISSKEFEVVKSWNRISDFIISDKWLSTKPLATILTQWQRIFQEMMANQMPDKLEAKRISTEDYFNEV